jgi:CRISPR-associated exonuclease Cas4
MLDKPVTHGALFYGQTRRRTDVVIDDTLRALTKTIIDETRAMIDSGRTPSAVYDSKRCDACSLIDLCQPRWLARSHGVTDWLRQRLED